MEVFAGLAVGFLGSLHCIGMCGPIVLTLPKSSGSLSLFGERILYNFGRIISYSLLGLVAGLIGASLQLAGLQQILSIFLGVTILVSIFIPSILRGKVPDQLTSPISRLFRSLWKKVSTSKSPFALLVVGVLNGFLPCGFVYVALAGALAMGSMSKGIAFMALFGLGTVPVMIGTAYAGTLISINLRRQLRRYVPVGAFLIAILLIMRGLNLGIPYISPKTVKLQVANDKQEVKMECCE